MRILVVAPSWVGDAVMATPALRLLRASNAGAFIGGLVRPGIDEVLAGLDLLDEVHVERSAGVMGPKKIAARIRPLRYDAALLLTNSFSTALITRLAGIPRRFGYARDARTLLLTDSIDPPRRSTESRRAAAREVPERDAKPGAWAPVPALAYYAHAAECFVHLLRDEPPPAPPWPRPWNGETIALPAGARMELGISPVQAAAGDDLLARAGLGAPFALLNPGGNNEAKRWPLDRFAALARHLRGRHALLVAANAAPGEADLARSLAEEAGVIDLRALGSTLGALKRVIARARLLVTNDTGPRHFAGALGVPVVALFGPTDPRWTTIPCERERVVAADESLPANLVADDHPGRCRVDRIELGRVAAACDDLLR